MRKILLLMYELRLIPAKWYAKFIGVEFGKRCYFQHIYFSTEPYLIKIGNRVQITSGTRFFTHSGGFVLRNRYPNWDIFGKISVGDNVYIGNCCLVMPGVNIGNNVIVGAGSVITKSIPDNVVVAGNPAKIISDLDTYITNNKQYNAKTGTIKNKKETLLSLPSSKFLVKEQMR